MPWGVAAAIGGAWIAADASRSSGNKQRDAQQDGLDEQARQYDQTREDNKQYRETGYAANSRLSDLLGLSENKTADGYGSLMERFTGSDLRNDPGYKFRMQQGASALENSAAARGGLFSGAAGRALTEYGQNFASNEYQNAYNRDRGDKERFFNQLSGISGTGQIATRDVNAAGQHYANQFANAQIGMANAQGASGMAQANAFTDGLNQVGAWGQRNAFGGTGGTGTSGGMGGFGGFSAFDSSPGGGIDPYGYLGGASTAGDYSDARLKTDIRRVGMTDEGQAIYVYRYIAGGPYRMGVMAQETDPSAVMEDENGFMLVDYSKVV